KEGKSLKINILPPIWLTDFALVVYGIFILGLLLLLRLIVLKRERLKFKNEQEKLEAQRRHELDMMKIKFFTNISHEFRTPLSLIITPLQKILKNTRDSEQKRQFELIHRNAKRLLHLVSQLLDFRKMEVQKISLNLMRGDFIKFAKDVFISFTDLAEIKNIQYNFQSNVDELYTNFDHDKIEKVLFNLLSNAFKFTHEKDSIKLALKYIEEDKNIELLNRTSSKFLEIKIIDTGIGIPEEKKEKIFQRFFQDDNQEGYINKGSGIGLSLTKEFVKLHQGDINVVSEQGKGSCFIVQLPVDTTDILKSDDNISIEIKHDIKVEEDEIIGHQKDISKKPTLLIVEDNEDFRFYLKDNLKNEYNVLEAGNGFEGWRVVLESSPDLVVSDLMMPEMDGLELCNKIKTDQRTSHIPIILLTARTADQQKKEGFETGADDYITKPFNFEIFELRLKNLIKQREALRKLFQKQIEIEPSEISVTPLDELFIKKAIEEVEENMSNPEYSVTELSRELNMSRTTLYKKLLALTGKTPIEFIRILRLKRAAQLLGQSQLSVSEIAYKVGFNDTRYFTKYFKTEFKELPSVYAAANKKENDRKFKI
ncbi:MAG: response regulator, partial [Bacteroidales bacterium]|nr:response regulator [Bacteroidales bacterium]